MKTPFSSPEAALLLVSTKKVQRHSGFEWLCKHNRSCRLRPEPIRFARLDSEHAQSDGKSVNRGLLVFDLAGGRDSWCWPKGARTLGTRILKTQVHSGSMTWEHIIICRQLFAGHVLGSRLLKRKEKGHRMINIFIIHSKSFSVSDWLKPHA